MNTRIRNRLLIILGVTILSVGLFAGFPPSVAKIKQRVKLGLDLKGGTHLVLQVVTRDALQAEANQAMDRLNADMRDKGVLGANVSLADLDIVVAGVPQDKDQTMRSIIDRDLAGQFESQVDYQSGGVQYRLKMMPQARKVLEQQTVQQALETIRQRVDALGVAEPTLQLYDNNANCIQAILAGRADTYINDVNTVDQAVKANPDKLEKAIAVTIPYSVGIAVPKNKPEFRDAVMAALIEVQKAGIHMDLLKRWDLDVNNFKEPDILTVD